MYLLNLEKVSLDFYGTIRLEDITVVTTPDRFSGITFDSKIPDFFMDSKVTKGFREKYPNIIVVKPNEVRSNIDSLDNVQKYLSNLYPDNKFLRLYDILKTQDTYNLDIDLNKIFFYLELPETGLTPIEQYYVTKLFGLLIRDFDCKILIRTVSPDLVQCMQHNIKLAPNKEINFVLATDENTYYKFNNYRDSVEEMFQFFNEPLDIIGE